MGVEEAVEIELSCTEQKSPSRETGLGVNSLSPAQLSSSKSGYWLSILALR